MAASGVDPYPVPCCSSQPAAAGSSGRYAAFHEGTPVTSSALVSNRNQSPGGSAST